MIKLGKKYDVIIVGTGVAGLNCAINLPEDKSILIICKDAPAISDSYLAQGGICCLRDDSDFEDYFNDTMRAGHYENDEESVECMIKGSREIIDDLISVGVDFEREEDGSLAYTREGGHGKNRILFHEDCTGKEITTCLMKKARSKKNILIVPYMTMLDLIAENNQCYGIVAKDTKNGRLLKILADYTVLATGGIGGIYENSTNFRILTGDALAIAINHGVEIKSINYVQVHPTTLYSKKKGRRFLISESVRGEGAILLDKNFARFCDELQPRDIVTKEILKQMFNIDVSTAFMSKLTQEVSEDVLSWRNRELNKCYFCINIDCTYISVRDKKCLNSHDIPIYVVVGTTLDGYKEIIGLYLGNEDEKKNVIDSLYNTDIAEAKSFWVTVFSDLKDRGLEKVLYVSSDALTGIEDAIYDAFPNTYYQRCVVHIVRNLKTYTNKSNQKEVISDFKRIYSSPCKEIANLNKNYFLDKYKDNITLIKHAKNYLEYIMPLFDIPTSIRNYIYTNNIVESVNSKIKRGFYGRGALPNVQSALNITYLNLIDLENKWKKKHVNNWENIKDELMQVHYEDIKDYLE